MIREWCALFLISVLSLSVGCGGESGGTGADGGKADDPDGSDAGVFPAAENWDHDIQHVELALDVSARTGVATLSTRTAADAVSLEIGDLTIESVSQGTRELPFEVTASQLDIGIARSDEATFQVRYSFASHADFDGWMPDAGVSFLWPTFCQNLFPCISDPDDGFTVAAEVTGTAPGQLAVFPASIPAAAPSYMFGIAVGDFEDEELGVTADGTTVRAIYPLALEAMTMDGTANLVEVFEYLETTLGPYTFGDSVATVAADWGGGDFGGMEHHPFWHVSTGSMHDEETHAHEAAHGWYGNGVRIACWEDFVLSEGLATYLSHRALADAGVDLSAGFACELKSVCTGPANTIVLPDDTCNSIDIINHPLWSTAPYIKGARFLMDVEAEIGSDALDAALSEFYQDHVGKAARMQDLIDHIKTKGSADAIDDLVTGWLRSEACPIDTGALCAS